MQSDNYIYYPERLTKKELDNFLKLGWYRMGQSLFTTHFIWLEENVHRVFWLRYNLNRIMFSKSLLRIKKRNEQFDVSIKPLEISAELEELYAKYKTALTFQPSHSVQNCLHGDRDYNVFNTDLIEVRDNGKLIAAGIADWGTESLAGIMNFYHPSYKKHSLGKFLMILKIEEAKKRNLQWYYPGYIVYRRSEFDYKLSVDKYATEILIPEQKGWQNFENDLIKKYGNLYSYEQVKKQI